MKDGFLKVAAGSVNVTVGDPVKNAVEIINKIHEADNAGVNLLVLPELCITGCTCGDLFYNELLLERALDALMAICKATEDIYPVVVVGLPLRHKNKLYNCAAILSQGNILGVVPKTFLSAENRQFSSASELAGADSLFINNEEVPFGTELLFRHEQIECYCFGVEIGDDLWAPVSPSQTLASVGAAVILNPSASNEAVSKGEYRKLLVKSTSARINAGYVMANAGPNESTQDTVYSGHHFIAENGEILAENKPFDTNELIISEIDLQLLTAERNRNKNFQDAVSGYTEIFFPQEEKTIDLVRLYEPNPFVPACKDLLDERAEQILRIQSYGLKKRLEHTHASCAVIGISGGLDSTLALLVAVRTMKLLNRPTSDVLAVTMPCFGTSARTKNNALALCNELGVTLKEIDITKSVRQHFADIEQDEHKYDVTFENAQARERTQVLMDIANQRGGLLVGTGDLSELALGWATYNGDHMSMYGVNASVPKTLVRCIVRYEAENANKTLRETLLDILDTPVSPELLPVDEKGELSQKTEDLVGPYELHDFYLYHFVRFGFKPQKLLRLAKHAHRSAYTDKELSYWLRQFLRRFFNQQFKRSCLPDGPKVGSVSLSPRGDWMMPTDASSAIWLAELDD